MTVAARNVELFAEDGYWAGRFRAMAGPCEVLVDTEDPTEARVVAERVAACAWRIEDKYSRYQRGNVIDEINAAGGRAVTVDEETAKLLDFAATLYDLSDGMFDVTSGVLRRAWTFDGGARVPRQLDIEALLPLVGWDKVVWQRPNLRLSSGMQLDFGGIGKEYAVDQATQIARNVCGCAALVNFGGDLAVSRPRADGRPWRVGIENPARNGQRCESRTRPATRSARDQRRHPSLRACRRHALFAHPESAHRVAGARCTAIGDGRGGDLHPRRDADHPCRARGRQCGALPGGRAGAALGRAALSHQGRTMDIPLFRLFDVLVTPWKLIGYAGVLLFAGRWVVQVLATQRQGRPAFPGLFWTMSISGSALLLAYFIWGKNDSVGVMSNLFPMAVALYNLMMHRREKMHPATRGAEARNDRGIAPVRRERVVIALGRWRDVRDRAASLRSDSEHVRANADRRAG